MILSELTAKLEALGMLDNETRNKVVCALIGHSKIQDDFLGLFTCGRCKAQVGDALGGFYEAKGVVVLGHDCARCRENFRKLGWEDKLYAPDPFQKETPDDHSQP